MEEDDSDIAAAMGFSSFGGTKKRKYDQSNSPKPRADASGANSTQLGVRTKKPATDQIEDVDVAPDAKSTTSLAAPSLPQAKSAQKPPTATGLADFLARAQTLPNKPPDTQQNNSMPDQAEPPAADMVSFGGSLISRTELYALRFGVKNENGDTAYFLPNFIGDPWEGMESGK
jgi:hypothetical protein